MIKFKHFLHIAGDGSGDRDAVKEAEEFVNKEGVDPVEISHSFSSSPHRVMSILITYVEVDKKQKAAIKAAVDKEVKKKASPTKKKPTKKGTK